MEPPTGPHDRLSALGNQLTEVHIWLREQLDQLTEDVDAHLDGRGGRPLALRTNLQARCLAFCSALDRHHTGEDGSAFPILSEDLPELRPVLENLRRDHDMLATILRNLEQLLSSLEHDRDPVDPAAARRVRGELDGLAALMDSHFAYEERTLVPVLNSLSAQGRESVGVRLAAVDAVFRPGG